MDYIRPLPPVEGDTLDDSPFTAVNCTDIPHRFINYTRYKDQENIELAILIWQAFDDI